MLTVQTIGGTGDPLAEGAQALGDADTTGHEINPIWWAVGTVSMGFNVYHGYKRNNGSIGWAIWWGLWGPFANALSLAQGYAKPIGGEKKALAGTKGKRKKSRK